MTTLPLENGGEALVDPGELLALRLKQWYRHPQGYAYRQEARGRIKVYLHRFLLGEPDGYVDHINRNKLDNRRFNLRVVSNSLNMLNAGPRSSNRSGYPGVCRARNNKWRAYVTVNYKQRWLGTFGTIEEAVSARAEAERSIDPERFNG